MTDKGLTKEMRKETSPEKMKASRLKAMGWGKKGMLGRRGK